MQEEEMLKIMLQNAGVVRSGHTHTIGIVWSGFTFFFFFPLSLSPAL